MDSLTHVVFGAALGEAILGKKAGKKAMLLGAIANSIPDLDVFLVFGDPIREITIHRGFSHSLVFPFLAAPVLAWLAQKYLKDKVEFKDWLLFFFVLVLTHPLLDCLTTYGTQLFLPFSDYRVNSNSLFIIDLFFTLPLIVTVIACWIIKTNSPNRKIWNRTGLAISFVYVLLGFGFKTYASHVFEDSLSANGIKSNHRMTGVTPLNILLWYTVAEVDSGYYIGNYSLLDKDKIIRYSFIRRNEEILKDVKNDRAVDRMIWFSNGFYAVERIKGETRFFTLKFGITGFELKNPMSESLPFYYILKKNPEGKVTVETIRAIGKMDWGKAFKELYQRVMGNKGVINDL